MSNNWYSTTTSGYESWFTSDWSSSVTKDVTCTYQVSSWSSDSDTANWFIPRDGLVNSWFAIERTIEVLDSVTQDSPTVSYDVGFSVYSTSPEVAYDIDSTLGFILGSGELPYGSAERDFTDTYSVLAFTTVERDFTDTYRIIGYADNVSPSVYYDVLNTVESDGVVEYQLAGYVQTDITATYDMVVAVEQDFTDTYRVVNAVTQDSSENTYDIVTVPLTAGSSAVVTYQVWQEVNTYFTPRYRILGTAERDFTDTYKVIGEVLEDKVVTYTVNSIALQDGVVTYDLFGKTPVERNQIFYYDINALSTQVPNVIGLPLGKAKKKLEQAGFQLGQITYQ